MQGGGIEGNTYTNSYDALDANYSKGFRYFEIDFVFTSDGHLVCLHDWQSNFRNTFHFNISHPLTLKEFNILSNKLSRYRNCDLSGLNKWLVNNPDSFIITDIKDDNIAGLKIIRQAISFAVDRVIPQIYKAQEFKPAKKLGYKRVIYTLYREKDSAEQIISNIGKLYGEIAITMPEKKLLQGLGKKILAIHDVPIYVHTVNDLETAKKYIDNFGATQIYTDFIRPNQL